MCLQKQKRIIVMNQNDNDDCLENHHHDHKRNNHYWMSWWSLCTVWGDQNLIREQKKISCSDLPEQMCTYGQDLPLIAGVWKKYSPMKDLFFSIKYYERWWDMIIMYEIWYDKILYVRENKRRTNQSHPHGCPIVLHLNSSQITWVLNLSSESEMQITRTTLSILYFLGSR